MKRYTYKQLLSLAALLLAACQGAESGKSNEAEGGVTTALPEERSEVTVQVLHRGDFHHQLVSNGKVSAAMQADLHFETTGLLAAIYVKNGDRVKRGQKLAELDKFRLSNATVQARNTLEKARLELQDVLIGQGYAANDSANVPAETMRLARVKSGYDQSLSQYLIALHEEEQATLTAPFDGVVANLFAKPYNTTGSADAFCTLVGTQEMEVDFTVLENELPLLTSGDRVSVTPYSDASARHEGRVTQINPLVDDKGMVKVKATVQGQGKLFSGMNVRISVHRPLGRQLVIPKSAVVMRSGKQVVFTLKNGRAQWNYVHTGLENADSYTVTDGLQEGDTVIVTGNVNLAHEAEVRKVSDCDL